MRTSIFISTISAALLAGTTIVSAQNEPKQEPKAAPKVQMSPDTGKDKAQSKPGAAQKPDPAKKETTGQGASPMQPGAQPRQAPSTQPRQGAQTPRPQGQGESETRGQAGAGAAPGAAVNLTAEQRNEIRTTVLQSKAAPKVSNPTFSISVGATVPRTVALVEVHPVLVRINSAWRGHRYFIVGDRIIIVDRNFRIVAVLTV
jgi:hypothetical protein